jgi:hypothetical protein
MAKLQVVLGFLTSASKGQSIVISVQKADTNPSGISEQMLTLRRRL